MRTQRHAAVIAALTLTLTLLGCSGSEPEPVAQATSAPTTAAPAPTAATPTEDPYEVYKRLAPKGQPTLSRQDAQTRALLGCGTKWAPGTVDAALAEAYKDLCTSTR